jgi:hypothetical protein
VKLSVFCVCESELKRSYEKGDSDEIMRVTYATCETHQFGSVPNHGLCRHSFACSFCGDNFYLCKMQDGLPQPVQKKWQLTVKSNGFYNFKLTSLPMKHHLYIFRATGIH